MSGSAQAATATYYMQTSTANLNGITANYGACGSKANGPVYTAMNTGGATSCQANNGKSAAKVKNQNAGFEVLMMISDTQYTQNTVVTGIDITANLKDKQETSNPGTLVGVRWRLGYVQGGTFTPFGFADEARDYDKNADWTTSLAGINGTAPTGSSLAFQALKQNPNGRECRIDFTSTSLILNVDESLPCSDLDPAVLTTSAPTSSSTVSGIYTVQTGITGEGTPSAMTNMLVNIGGAGACNVTNGAMTWNAGSSVWEYTWDTSACGTSAVVSGVAVSVSGTDPDCTGITSAPQITNVSIDNRPPGMANYYMQTSLANLNGIMGNYDNTCSNVNAPVYTSMNKSGSNACTGGRSKSTGNVNTEMLLVISDTAYTQDMSVTGVSVTGRLRDFQETSNPGTQVGLQYQLGYVQGGVFQSLGFANEARDWDSAAQWTTDLSGISGTVPLGASLAIRALKKNSNGTEYRYYFTSTSLQLNVIELPACSDTDPATLTTIAPTTGATVAGTYTVSVTIGTETLPGTMTSMLVNIGGAGACNVTNGAMTWNSGTSAWEYAWATGACGTVTIVSGVTVDASGTDPDCPGTINAPQVSNVTIDNRCTDGDPATSVTITPASGSTVGGTVTVQAAIGGETTPGAIGASATTTVTGSISCNVTNQAMVWNAASSVWEYAWNTSACGLATPDTGVTIQVTYTDPDCSGKTVISNSSTAITIDNADPSKLTSCGACHRFGATFADGSARNVPAGIFPGSHGLHANTYAFVCSKCHIVPATETSADFAHRNGTIQMAVPINGDIGAAYGKGTSWPQTNTPSAFSQCNNTYCHSNGTSVISGSIAVNSSPTWGSSSNCGSCHGTLADDGRPNYVNGTPKRNTHGDGVSYGVTHKATACPTCHVGVSGTAGAYSMNPATHVNGSYDLQPSLGYVQSTGTCNTPGCHGTAVWGTSLGCVDCHSSPQTGTHGTPRDAVVSEFGLAWGHKKSVRGAITNADCIVCHLEGVYATQAKSAVHGDGNIDLRDPDGAGETAITNVAGGVFTFTKFATSYAVGSRTTTGHLSNSVDNVLTQKFCLACHDANGASNPTARTTGGTAFMPWGGVNLGANYTVANGAAAPGGLINAFGQFATTNSSAHPVRGPRNKGYPTPARYAVPYNNFTRTAGTLANGVVINCFDCHNSPTPLTNRTVAAHGSSAANYMRGVVTVSGTPAAGSNEATLCTTCHAGYNTATTNGSHEAGSAATNLSRSEKNPFMRYGCNMCHSSGYATPTVRPVRAMDVHGVNVLPSTGQTLTGGWAAYGRPYAFIRNRSFLGDHQPARIGGTNYNPQCNMAGNNGDGNSICRNKGTKTYSVGGVY